MAPHRTYYPRHKCVLVETHGEAEVFACVLQLTIYAPKQGDMTFSFFFTVCREIKFTLQRWWGN